MKGRMITHNVNLLYFIFLIAIVNMLWFVYYNQRCILVYICLCLAIYIINKNMIFVLGISLILVDSFYLLNLVKKEGFWGDSVGSEGFDMSDNENDETDKNAENYKNYDIKNAKRYNDDDDMSSNSIDSNIKNAKGYDDMSSNSIDSNIKKETENFLNMLEGYEDEDEENDEESKYMHDKSIIKKLKQLNPLILNTLENMNSVHIKEINKTINNLTDKIDP